MNGVEVVQGELDALKRQLADEFAREQQVAATLESMRANRLRLEGVVMYLEQKFGEGAGQPAAQPEG